MTAPITLSAESFVASLKELSRVLGIKGRELIRDEFRLAIQTLIRFTPPASQKQGRGRVAGDLDKVIKPFNIDQFRNKRLEHIVETGDFAAFTGAMKHIGNPVLQGARAEAFTPDLHRTARDNRGRVSRRSRANLFAIGDDRRELLKHRTTTQGNVGIARSGWAAAFALVGGKPPAKWISRHGNRYGSATIERPGTDRETLVATNATPWASRRDEGERQLARMYAQRAKSIAKKTQILRDAGRAAGFRTA